jgi:hypothetical protein
VTHVNFLERTAVLASWLLLAASLSACQREPDSAEAPPQLRRLTEAQYRQTIADLFGPDIRIVGRFEPDLRVDGLLAVGSAKVSVSPAGIEQYEAIARDIAGQVVAPGQRERWVGCGPAAADPKGEACAKRFFERVGSRLYRRPLETAELTQLSAATLQAAAGLESFDAGLAAVLAGMLSAPDFLFRMDRMAGSGGRPRLDPYSKATRLSYFLWNTTPDETLWAAAARGDLDTDEGLAREVDRMIASPRFAEGVRAFLDDFLRLDGLETLSKDSLIFPAFGPAVAVDAREQTLRTAVDLLVTRQADYRDLFTDRQFAMNRRLGPIYDVPVAGTDWSMHRFPDTDPRAGLLTHVGFLALHSHPGRTSPTLRGMAIREVLMCEEIPTPPANVNFTIVQDVSNPELKTTRERLQAHLSDAECASCHKLTDPIGLALEQFDGLGQFRLAENGSAIDASGRLGELSFADAAQFGAALAKDPAVVSCLVQSAWRYASGRGIGRSERGLVRYLEDRFADADHRVPALMRLIATSRAFHAVTAPAADSAAAQPLDIPETKS